MATYESKKYASIPIAATQVADGSVTNAEFQFINTVSSNVQTQVDAKAATAGATFTGAVRINDSQNLLIGRKSKKAYKVGDKIGVKSIKVDILKYQVDLELT